MQNAPRTGQSTKNRRSRRLAQSAMSMLSLAPLSWGCLILRMRCRSASATATRFHVSTIRLRRVFAPPGQIACSRAGQRLSSMREQARLSMAAAWRGSAATHSDKETMQRIHGGPVGVEGGGEDHAWDRSAIRFPPRSHLARPPPPFHHPGGLRFCGS